MKILYYSGHPHLNLSANTGYGTHMREIIKGFENQGHEVRTLIIGGESTKSFINSTTSTPSFRQKVKRFIPNIIWETIKDIQLLKKDKASLLDLDQVIQEFKPDFIYERGYYLLKSGLITSLKYNTPHILELNAPYVEERVKFSGKSLLLSKAKKIEKFQLKKATSIVVVSTALKSYFNQVIQNIDTKILVTPNAINPNKINLDNEQQKIIKD